jgi:uncharacterized protein YdeI (BOF family)
MKRFVILTLAALFAVTTFAQPGGHSGSSTKSSPSGATYSQSSSTDPTTIANQTYSCTTSDYNVIQVTGGTLNVNNCTLSKTGDTSDSDGSSFFGINSSVYVNGSGAIINMTGGSITSACKGANGGFAYGSGVLNISDVTITNTGNLSRGIHATGGGTINATNLTIKTSGSNSSVVATDRGGGTVTVTKGSYITTGTDCAILYSTGTITANDATGSSSKGEVGVIEGNNSITINNCDFTSGSSTRGLMILQSGSGDATGYNGKITINGGSITMTDSSAPLCEIPTNMTGTLTLKDVNLTVPSAVLMKVDYNTRWSTNGGTGNLILESDGTWTVNGTVATDSYAKALNVTVGSGVTWNLSDDTTIKGTLTINSGGTVNKNGHTLTYTTLVNNGTLTDVSAINTINTASESSTGNVYNVQGQLVKKAATDLKGLPAGIYILNGKKFFVR